MGLDAIDGLYTITFVEVDGGKMTFPLGAKTAASHDPVDATGPTFENPVARSDVVLYMPIFLDDNGAITTFPFGKSTPEPKRLRPEPAIGPTFVKAKVVGLKTPMLAESLGTITTLPDGFKTPP